MRNHWVVLLVAAGVCGRADARDAGGPDARAAVARGALDPPGGAGDVDHPLLAVNGGDLGVGGEAEDRLEAGGKLALAHAGAIGGQAGDLVEFEGVVLVARDAVFVDPEGG